jgi:secreted Zn-dependent insulinase-like peptidase
VLYKHSQFDRNQQLANAVNNVSPAELKAYYKEIIEPNRRLWLVSKELKPAQLNGMRVVSSAAEFKREAVVYSYP